jgi:hypothetical protein
MNEPQSLPSFQTIPALGAVMDGKPEIPIHARKACASLLSRQVLRPDGLHGLYSAIFGSEDGRQDEAPLEKLEEVYRVLAAVPSHLTPEVSVSSRPPRGIYSRQAGLLLRDAASPSNGLRSAIVISSIYPHPRIGLRVIPHDHQQDKQFPTRPSYRYLTRFSARSIHTGDENGRSASL